MGSLRGEPGGRDPILRTSRDLEWKAMEAFLL
jgi:hypothetical protein